MKFEIVTIEDKQVTFDVSMLMKEDAVMINATEIAKKKADCTTSNENTKK